MKPILDSIRESFVNECGGSGCGGGSSYYYRSTPTPTCIEITGGQIKNAAKVVGAFGRDNLKVFNKAVEELNDALTAVFKNYSTPEKLIDRVIKVTDTIKDIK